MRTVLKGMALLGLLVLLAGCDLAITKVDDPDPAFVGKKLTYTLEVTNNQSDPPPNPEGPGGDGSVGNAVVGDQLPASVDFVSATPSQGTCEDADEDNAVFCELGELELDQSATVKVVVTPREVGKIENTAATQNCATPSPTPSPPDAAPGFNEEGTLVCFLLEDMTDVQAAEMLALQERSAEITAREEAPQGEAPQFCNSPEACDPQEDNTVTISTRVLPVPPPPPPPAPDPNPNACTITGTNGNDNIVGTSGDDVICGLGGNDNISGGRGDDVIRGSDGNDSLAGKAGNDTLSGGADNDHLVGGPGRDRLDGGPGRDKVVR